MNEISLPSVVNARLPQSYEHAKSALATCASLDECQDWADKSAALASYAKQADDDALMNYAVRVRDRAIRRAGELLKLIEPAKGARTDLGQAPTRGSAATDAGMSPHQAKQAMRVANVPTEQFETMVEGPKPPTVTKLAAMGTKPNPAGFDYLQGRDPSEFNRALHFVALFENYAKKLDEQGLELLLPTLTPDERSDVRGFISQIDLIHDHIITRI